MSSEETPVSSIQPVRRQSYQSGSSSSCSSSTTNEDDRNTVLPLALRPRSAHNNITARSVSSTPVQPSELQMQLQPPPPPPPTMTPNSRRRAWAMPNSGYRHSSRNLTGGMERPAAAAEFRRSYSSRNLTLSSSSAHHNPQQTATARLKPDLTDPLSQPEPFSPTCSYFPAERNFRFHHEAAFPIRVIARVPKKRRSSIGGPTTSNGGAQQPVHPSIIQGERRRAAIQRHSVITQAQAGGQNSSFHASISNYSLHGLAGEDESFSCDNSMSVLESPLPRSNNKYLPNYFSNSRPSSPVKELQSQRQDDNKSSNSFPKQPSELASNYNRSNKTIATSTTTIELDSSYETNLQEPYEDDVVAKPGMYSSDDKDSKTPQESETKPSIATVHSEVAVGLTESSNHSDGSVNNDPNFTVTEAKSLTPVRVAPPPSHAQTFAMTRRFPLPFEMEPHSELDESMATDTTGADDDHKHAGSSHSATDHDIREVPPSRERPSLATMRTNTKEATSPGAGSSRKNNISTHTLTSVNSRTRPGLARAKNFRNAAEYMSLEDIEICQRLDEEYEQALEEREVGYTARYNSVRQSACFSVVFMAIYLTLGTMFYMKVASWTLPEALFFSIYTITSVGYGCLEPPRTPSFQIYTIFYIFVGIATLTIMVAQVYQCIALEASRAQHGRDKSEMARRGLDIISRLSTNRIKGFGPGQMAAGGATSEGGSDGQDGSPQHQAPLFPFSQHLIAIPFSMFDRLLAFYDRLKFFFRENEIGRSLSVLFPFAGLIAIGAAVTGAIENWTAVEAIYYSVVSLTTVGYGDYCPKHTAGIWFAIVWLPFSVGFMSLFLGNVAAFYIRLSDKNIERIERHLRRRMARAKHQAELEREAARRRAMRGQVISPPAATIEMGNVTDDGSLSDGVDDPKRNKRRWKWKKKGQVFDSVPVDDDKTDMGNKHSMHGMFGPESVTGIARREIILNNSLLAGGGDKDNGADWDEEEEEIRKIRPTGSSMITMKDVLTKVHLNLPNVAELPFRSGPESEYLSIRSTSVSRHFIRRSEIRKPSFALRVLVQERFAHIIATDIAGFQSSIEIKENTLSVTVDTLKQTADKWLVPRRARKAFRAVAFEALYFVGEHGLITRGAEALFDLSPFEFHGLFSPLLAAFGDAETMEGWLASTEILAEVDLNRDSLEMPATTATADNNNLRPGRGSGEFQMKRRASQLVL